MEQLEFLPHKDKDSGSPPPCAELGCLCAQVGFLCARRFPPTDDEQACYW